jgi:hypothetical protein
MEIPHALPASQFDPFPDGVIPVYGTALELP